MINKEFVVCAVVCVLNAIQSSEKSHQAAPIKFKISEVHSLRRISKGNEVKADKRYVVYFVKAKESPEQYNAWLCGGAIVSEWYIVTSAACVEDITYMYAIAGYKLSVNTDELESDECAKQTKKKVVYTCVPKAYQFVYDKIEKWSNIDIAVVKVESAYKLSNIADSPSKGCSYSPTSIKINYDPKYQEPGTDVIVLGWGHLSIWRKPEDLVNHNQKELRYASTVIIDKEYCKNKYDKISGYREIISKYMICTSGTGNLDDAGNIIHPVKPTAEGCSEVKTRNGSYISNPECVKRMDETRRNMSTRRQGICQNDHGGPLVTWIGSNEVLLGVASVFRVNRTNETSLCEGPYLYTSTQCNGAFLNCVLNQDQSGRRNAICDKPPVERGFDMIETRISWKNHSQGPADNEVLKRRPQIPINQYNTG